MSISSHKFIGMNLAFKGVFAVYCYLHLCFSAAASVLPNEWVAVASQGFVLNKLRGFESLVERRGC